MKNKFYKSLAAYAVLAVALLGSAAVNILTLSKIENKAVCFSLNALALVLLVFVYALNMFHTRRKLDSNDIYLLCATIWFSYTVCIFAARINEYAMPIFLTAFLLAPLAKRKDSFLSNLFCVIMVFVTLLIEGAADTSKILNMLIIGIFAGTVCVFCVSYQRRRLDFILKGLAVCLGSIAAVLFLDTLNLLLKSAFSLDLTVDVLLFCSAAIFVQLVLSLFLQPVSEKAFNLLTNWRLIELTDHHSPLIKRLIDEAPGTFNHCLAVANFAEVCATAINENPYFVRACAYYHDIGKLSNPQFFKENQGDVNHHDNLLPEVSAKIIRSHTTDGLELCLKHRIPMKLAQVTIEHHGTLPITVFFNKAKELTDGVVNVKEYSYDGQTPSSKAAAIIMICDSAEAAIRAMDSQDPEKIDALVSGLILGRIKSGQFDDCDITMKELNTIKDTIIMACGGVFHKRVKYPEGK